MALDLTCTNEEKIPVSATPVTSTGKPAPLDGPVKVTVTSGDATVVSTGDTSFELVSGDAPGDSTFLIEADADLGSGVVTISDTISLHVAGALATSLGLNAGAAVPK